jgi:pimeloyl-ACP methyl ester carboxylesterase
VVYVSHGTGGDYQSMVRDGTCGLLGAQGIAAVGIDQILHGPRARGARACLDFGEVEECFLSPVNATAGRNLLRHAAIDHLSLRRMVEGLVIAAGDDPEGRVLTFDTARAAFFGHSQGALTGSIYLAVEPEVRGALLSGGGGHVSTTIMLREEGLFRELLESPLYLNIAGRDELDPFHPALALLQTFAEVADPLSYGRYWHRSPVAGRKSVFKTSGLQDVQTPAATAVALAVAAGLPQLQGGHLPSPSFVLAGLDPVAPPVVGNVLADGDHGEVTAVLRQFPDGDHFVIFRDASVRAQASTFFATLLGDDTPRVPEP